MALKNYKVHHTLHGNYGIAEKGDVIELEENEVKHLLDNGVISESKNAVTKNNVDVEAQNKKIDEKHKHEGFLKEKKQTKPSEKKVITKPGS